MSNIETVWQPDRAHNQLPTLPPGHDLESKVVLRACIAARVALAELKQAAELIPNRGCPEFCVNGASVNSSASFPQTGW